MRMTTPEFFRRTELLLGSDAIEALTHTRVIVFGVGGVGGWCAEALVRSGMGHVTLVDDDVVAPSNVNRQLPATTCTLGRAKTDVLKERFLEINPSLSIDALRTRYTPETAGKFQLEGFNFVVDAIDSVACKAHLIRSALALPDLTLFSSMGAGGRIDPTQIRTTPFTRVRGDGLARALRTRFRRDGGMPGRDFTCVWSEEQARNRGGRHPEDGRANGSFMPVTASFGLQLAALVLRTAAGLA